MEGHWGKDTHLLGFGVLTLQGKQFQDSESESSPNCSVEFCLSGISSRSPVVPFYPFWGEGSPTKTDYREKIWYPYSNLSTGGPSHFCCFPQSWQKIHQDATVLHATDIWEPRSSSREVRIWVPFFSVVYFSGGTLPTKNRGEKGRLAGDLGNSGR